MTTSPNDDSRLHVLLPVLALRDVCLFPGASLAVIVSSPASLKAVEMAMRSALPLVVLAQKENAPLDSLQLHEVGSLAAVVHDSALSEGGRRVELDGLRRVRCLSLLTGPPIVAEVELLEEEEDPGADWGTAVEALARYMHSHSDLRTFLDEQRRSAAPMSWVNLACQHLPITTSARQRLLEADASDRCLKISRGLDALLRKEQSA
jgi:ATP-dependent Lon protease